MLLRTLLKFEVVAVLLSTLLCSFSLSAKGTDSFKDQNLLFIENKGQVKDQNGIARDDIQFSIHDNGINVFIGNGSIHYQFYKKEKTGAEIFPTHSLQKDIHLPAPVTIETYRMDVCLVNADQNAEVITEQVQEYYENYVTGCSVAGEQAHAYEKVIYKNVYPDIDWVLYIKNNKLEQEFVVRPGGDASMIKLQYDGQTGLEINEDGSITATTPMGIIKEEAPVCNLFNNDKVKIAYTLHKNILSYDAGDYGHSLVIDPVLEWGTYYGPDSSSSPFSCVATDGNENIYACGTTYAATQIATAGSFQSVFTEGTMAYLVKFDSSGNRIWATYYGGDVSEIAYAVACDNSGDIYMGGFTSSNDSLNMATPGAWQPSLGGATATNGFLIKFNSSGSRMWSTYYGGRKVDEIYSVSCDNYNHVYIAGITTSPNNIASAGAFKSSFKGGPVEGFLAQFDSAGTRKWGTYYFAYTDTNFSDLFDVSSGSDGINVYISGWTAGTDSVSTPGAWQTLNAGGGGDAILVKFDSAGHRKWGTYYGGAAQDVAESIVCDKNSNIYMLGATGSDAGIASAGSFQPSRGGGQDAFIAVFEPALGHRIWGTYYGGPGDESISYSHISHSFTDEIYITGSTGSSSGIASAGAWQTAFGGGTTDAFLAAYNASGIQIWSTYYGGSGDDYGFATVGDGVGAYVCGQTNSIEHMATHGSLDSTYSGSPFYNKGFLGKFETGPSCPLPAAAFSDSVSGSATFIYTGTTTGLDSVKWYFGDGTSDTGVMATHTYAASGTYTVCVTAYNSCGSNGYCDTVTVTGTDTGSGVKNINTMPGIAIFPNPAAGQITVAHAATGTDLKLFNSVGQYIYGCTVTSDQQLINIGNLPPGNYILQITGNDGSRINKIVTKE